MPRKNSAPSRRRVSKVDAAERALVLAGQDPANITGIYNYCDRWCERCEFTSRCLTFKMGEARRRGKKGTSSARRTDLENAAFWDDIAVNFALALRLAKREAKKRGIDLDSPAMLDEAKREERRRKRRETREGSALHAAAIAYQEAAMMLLNRMTPELRSAEDVLALQARLGTGTPEATAAEIRDALEVVEWYLFFINAKLQRAVGSRVDSPPLSDDFPSDADGSAKIALVAIDRSLAAWARLRPHLAGESDAIIDLLVQLERLRQSVEGEFPNARSFKRPGFD